MGRAGSGKGAKGASRGGQGPGKHMGWGVDGVLGARLGAALTASSAWWMELRVRRGQREPPHSRLFLRGIGCLGRAPGNMLFFPVHDLFLLSASVSPPQIVTRNWDTRQAPSMPVTGPHAWHFVGS